MRKLLNDDLGKNLLAQNKEEKFGFKNNKSNLNVQQSDIIKMRKIKKPFENNINFKMKKNINKEENINNLNNVKNNINNNTNNNINNNINNNNNVNNDEQNILKINQELLKNNETFAEIKELKNDIVDTLNKDILNLNKNNIDNNNINQQEINNFDNNKNIDEKISEDINDDKS